MPQIQEPPFDSLTGGLYKGDIRVTNVFLGAGGFGKVFSGTYQKNQDAARKQHAKGSEADEETLGVAPAAVSLPSNSTPSAPAKAVGPILQRVAVKFAKIPESCRGGDFVDIVMRHENEVELMLKLEHHPHICGVVDASTAEQHATPCAEVYICTPLHKGSLQEFLDEATQPVKDAENQQMSSVKNILLMTPGSFATSAQVLARTNNTLVTAKGACQVLVQQASALESLHGLGYAHRDVKPANILVTWGGDTLLADFGISCRQDHCTTRAGTRDWLNAEALSRDGATNQTSDVYGLVLIFAELLLGKGATSSVKMAGGDEVAKKSAAKDVLLLASKTDYKACGCQSAVDILNTLGQSAIDVPSAAELHSSARLALGTISRLLNKLYDENPSLAAVLDDKMRTEPLPLSSPLRQRSAKPAACDGVLMERRSTKEAGFAPATGNDEPPRVAEDIQQQRDRGNTVEAAGSAGAEEAPEAAEGIVQQQEDGNASVLEPGGGGEENLSVLELSEIHSGFEGLEQLLLDDAQYRQKIHPGEFLPCRWCHRYKGVLNQDRLCLFACKACKLFDRPARDLPLSSKMKPHGTVSIQKNDGTLRSVQDVAKAMRNHAKNHHRQHN